MSFGFLLFPDSQIIASDFFKVSLNDSPIPNRRTKFDRTNLTCIRGDDESYAFTAYVGKNVADLSNSSIIATGRVNEQADSQLFSIPIIDNIDGSEFINGIFVFNIPRSITINLPTLLKYDIKMTNFSTNKVFTLVSGQIEVRTEYLTNKNTIP
jgi:hypothetical protein